MRATRLGFAIVVGLTLGTAVVGARSPLAGASVVNQCGEAATWVSPLPNFAEGVHESNSTMTAFQERSNLVLPSALPVDIIPPVAYPRLYNSVGSLTPSLVPSGTTVDSYFIYSDPVGRPQVAVRYVATLTFSTAILGVIVQSATLNSSDGVAGAPDTTYSSDPFNGLELGPSYGNGVDRVELTSPTTLYINVSTTVDTDAVRVITAGSPSGASNGASPQYTEVASDGGIFNFGSQFFGSQGGQPLNRPMVGGSAVCGTPGYWTVASDGGIFAFGSAGFFGSTGSIHLNKPVVGMAATPDGQGYWLVASDGGIFSFGDATFYGSTGNIHLNKPVVAMKATPDGLGYWLVASDGGIFAYGDAPFLARWAPRRSTSRSSGPSDWERLARRSVSVVPVGGRDSRPLWS